MSLLAIQSHIRNLLKRRAIVLQIQRKLVQVHFVRRLCEMNFSWFFLFWFIRYREAQNLHQIRASFHIEHNWDQFRHIQRRQILKIMIIQRFAAFFHRYIIQITHPRYHVVVVLVREWFLSLDYWSKLRCYLRTNWRVEYSNGVWQR